MLYVFHVDTGLMLTFDMNLAMETVSKLQEAIAASYNIQPDKQVMLISGGENLDPNARVCSYSAGTDTNPIFLFSRSTIESATPPSASVNYGSETDLQDQVEGSLNMGPTYETVVARAQLALQIHDVGREELRICERLVHDQHLQHQGWAAVVANLEDITSAFKKRSEALWASFDEFSTSRDSYVHMLESFDKTMDLLGKIPLLPCLVGERYRLFTPDRNSAASSTPSESATAISSGTSFNINKSVASESSAAGVEGTSFSRTGSLDGVHDGESLPVSLLEWISAQDNRSSIEQMVLNCQQGLEQFTPALKETLIGEMNSLLEAVHNPSMKEVKGLEDRLYGLEQLMYGARKLVQEQHEMAQGFVQNQNRASNLRDPSVLPDLCQSHKRQLLVMLKNHQSLRDIRRRCTLAKDELAANLHTRLRWIMYVEKSLCDKDNKLMIHQATLRKLKRRLHILQQMNDAPQVYARAIVEVVRRKAFSKNFLEWAGTFADDSSVIHETEVGKREEFLSCIERHFLKNLFPGLEDQPPPFATKAPSSFDTKLPPITPDDVTFLSNRVPELADKLKVPSEDDYMEKFILMSDKKGLAVGHTLAATLQNTLKAVVESHSGSSTPTRLSQSPAKVSGLAKDDMCTSDIVVLTHEMSDQAAEGGTLTAQGTVQPLEPKIVNKTSGATQAQDSDGSVQKGCLNTDGEVPRISPAKSDLVQSVEVLDEEEEEEFLSLQAEMPGETMPADLVSGPGTATAQPVVVVDTKLKNSTSGSSAEIVPRGGSTGSLRTMARSPPKADRRERHKSTPDTSPSLEEVNSEGFTTADFYIDESMPSSMTESPPTKKMVAELQSVLQEKSAQLDAKERELEQQRKALDTVREKLTRTEESFKLLHDTAEKGTLQLKCDVLSIEKQVAKDKDEFSNYMSTLTMKLLQVIEKFETQQADEKDATLNSMKTQYEDQLEVLRETLEIETQKLADSQEEINMYHRQLKERDDKYDSYVSLMQNNLAKAEEKWQGEVEETRKQLILEHEIEMDRVQTELKDEIEKKENEVSSVSQLLKEAEDSLQIKIDEVTKKMEEEHEKQLQELEEKYVREQAERKESLELEIREVLSKAHQEDLETQEQEHQRLLEEKCEQLRVELEKVKLSEIAALREETEKRHAEELEELEAQNAEELSQLTKTNQEQLEASNEEHVRLMAQVEEKHQQLIEELEKAHEKSLSDQEMDFEQKLEDANTENQNTVSDLLTRQKQELNELQERLTLEKFDELQSMQHHLEEQVKESPLKTDGYLSREEHEEIVDQLNNDWESKMASEIEKALIEQRNQQEAAIQQLKEEMDKEKPEPAPSTSMSAAAEKQTVFNEALKKVVAEKDKVIEELKGREAALILQHEDDTANLERVMSGTMGLDEERDLAIKLSQEREERLRLMKKTREEEVGAAQNQIRQLQEQLHMTTSVASSGSVISASSSPLKLGTSPSNQLSQSVIGPTAGMGASIMPFPEPACTTSMYDRIQELETHLKTKEDEVSELSRKLHPHSQKRSRKAQVLPAVKENSLAEMQMSMSSSSRAFVQDKVSITTCNVGDIVLLCLDERHDHYVVFNMGTTLHFLHSDCLEPLGLKTGAAEARKSWVLAEITDKEYCQAKKAQNRFRVPLGTKFYRVKARGWDREAALQREQAVHKDGGSPSKSQH